MLEIADAKGNYYALTRDRIDACSLAERIRQDIDGALVVFEYIVQNNNQGKSVLCLEYECQEELAIQVFRN